MKLGLLEITQMFFPEELQGMPTNRDIEFIIELLPETPPISKRPYRMPMNELVELKKQIVVTPQNYKIWNVTKIH
jgi:hypothetical protein